ADGRRLGKRSLRRLRLRATSHPLAPAVRPRAEHVLRLLRVRHGQVELGAAFVLRRADRRDGARRIGGVPALPALSVPPSAGCTSIGSAAGLGGTRGRATCPSARVGDDGRSRRNDGRKLLLPDDAVLLLLCVRGARARLAARLRAPPARMRYVARAEVVVCVGLSIAFGAIYFPRALSDFDGTASNNSAISFS